MRRSRVAPAGLEAGRAVLYVACVLAVTLAGPVRAETLTEALVKAYQTNPDLAAERAETRAVDEEVSQANARWRPSISLEGEAGRDTSRVKDKTGKFDVQTETWSADVVASQPLFTGGRNGARKGQALARVRGARARLLIREQQVLLDVVIAFVNIARNEAVLDLVRGDIVLLQELLDEARTRRDAKKATDSDVDQALAALEAARAQCLANYAELQDSWRSYEQVVGEVPALSALEADAPKINPCVDAKGARTRSTIAMPRDLPPAPASLEDVEAAVQGRVPELEAARAEEEESRYAVSASYAELLPSAALTARLGTNGQEFDPQSISREASVSAELSIPLFNTGAEWSEIRAARERNNRARLNITSRQRQVTRDAVRAWYDLVSVRAIRTVNKEQAASVLRAFEGLRKEIADPKLHRSVTDLLGLRRDFLGTQRALIASDRDEAVAVYRLVAAMGRMNARDLALPVAVYDAESNLKKQRGRLIGDSIQGE